MTLDALVWINVACAISMIVWLAVGVKVFLPSPYLPRWFAWGYILFCGAFFLFDVTIIIWEIGRLS